MKSIERITLHFIHVLIYLQNSILVNTERNQGDMCPSSLGILLLLVIIIIIMIINGNLIKNYICFNNSQLLLAVAVIQLSFIMWFLGSRSVSSHQLLQQYRLHNCTLPGAACSYMGCSQTFHLLKQNNSLVASQHREQDVTASEHAKEIRTRPASKLCLLTSSPGSHSFFCTRLICRCILLQGSEGYVCFNHLSLELESFSTTAIRTLGPSDEFSQLPTELNCKLSFY